MISVGRCLGWPLSLRGATTEQTGGEGQGSDSTAPSLNKVIHCDGWRPSFPDAASPQRALPCSRRKRTSHEYLYGLLLVRLNGESDELVGTRRGE